MTIPDANAIYPNPAIKEVVFIKNVIKSPNIEIGDYTYYDDPVNSTDLEKHVTHDYEFLGDKLIIGKFCSIASGFEFIMNGGNEVMRGVSTYTFNIFGGDWQKYTADMTDMPFKADAVE